MSPEVVLEADSVTRRFGGLVAVSNLSFAVNRGEIFGVIGPNGAGKTTLFALLTGNLEPSSGEVRLRGRRLTGLKPHAVVRRGVVRTHQIVRPFRDLTVRENVLIGASFGSAPRKGQAARSLVGEVLTFCRLDHRADSLAGSLTLGELKRLEICRALATEPEIIMLDEVMGGLNPAEIDAAMELIVKIRSAGRTVLLIEHHMRAVAGLCERLMVLNFGCMIATGPTRDVLTDPAVVEAYLGQAVKA